MLELEVCITFPSQPYRAVSVYAITNLLSGQIDIIGQNSFFVDQSSTFPHKFTDFKPEDATDKSNRAKEMIAEAFEKDCGGIPVTGDSTLMWRILAGLGSHDLSVMREALGMPEKVVGTSLGFPFWTYVFPIPGRG
jgi:hypothetical protein